MASMHILGASAVLSEPGAKRTVGAFSQLVNDNREVFRKYFGIDLYPGSLNIDVGIDGIHDQLDGGSPRPAFVIPRDELIGMPDYLGDGQAWPCRLLHEESGGSVDESRCWVFRRIRSAVPPTVLELVSPLRLRDELGMKHDDRLMLTILASSA